MDRISESGSKPDIKQIVGGLEDEPISLREKNDLQIALMKRSDLDKMEWIEKYAKIVSELIVDSGENGKKMRSLLRSDRENALLFIEQYLADLTVSD